MDISGLRRGFVTQNQKESVLRQCPAMMQSAAEKGHTEVVRCLRELLTSQQMYDVLRTSSAVGLTAIHTAACRSNTEALMYMLNSVTTEQYDDLLAMEDKRGFTALHIAASRGRTANVRCMLEPMTPECQLKLICAQSNCGSTALDMAAKCRKWDTREWLLKHMSIMRKLIKYGHADEGRTARVIQKLKGIFRGSIFGRVRRENPDVPIHIEDPPLDPQSAEQQQEQQQEFQESEVSLEQSNGALPSLPEEVHILIEEADVLPEEEGTPLEEADDLPNELLVDNSSQPPGGDLESERLVGLQPAHPIVTVNIKQDVLDQQRVPTDDTASTVSIEATVSSILEEEQPTTDVKIQNLKKDIFPQDSKGLAGKTDELKPDKCNIEKTEQTPLGQEELNEGFDEEPATLIPHSNNLKEQQDVMNQSYGLRSDEYLVLQNELNRIHAKLQAKEVLQNELNRIHAKLQAKEERIVMLESDVAQLKARDIEHIEEIRALKQLVMASRAEGNPSEVERVGR